MGLCVCVCRLYVHSGISDAKAELRKNYRVYKINTLCIQDETGLFRVICFHKADPLLRFAKSFHALTRRPNSNLFRVVWCATMMQAQRNNPKLSIKCLESEVWIPAFQQCQILLKDVYELNITLSDVDRYFGSYGDNDLTAQIRTLFDGVNECTENKFKDYWNSRLVQKVVDYRLLCSYQDAANSFLKLRDLLQLTQGDFRDVERISKKVIRSQQFLNISM